MLKVNVLPAAKLTAEPSTKTWPMLNPVLGVTVKTELAPELTTTLPDGLMMPPEPAEAVIVKVVGGITVNVAAIV